MTLAFDPRRQRPRSEWLRAGVLVSCVSAAWGGAAGSAAVVSGIGAQSIALVGTGADIVADLVSTLFLIWRFQTELRGGHPALPVERYAQRVSSACLIAAAGGLTISAVIRIGTGEGADVTGLSLGVAALSVVALPSLSRWKYRVAAAIPSGALHTDATIGMVGAATALLTLIGLVLSSTAHWWLADPLAGLFVAGGAGVLGYRGWASPAPPHLR